MRKTISFNGCDNVGKTTQIRLLKRQLDEKVVVVPSLPELNPDWKKVSGDFFWYFGQTEHEAWLKLMLDSLLIRDQFVKNIKAGLILLDRGSKMSLLYIAAALKERLRLRSLSEAKDLLMDYIALNYQEFCFDQEDLLILLKQSTEAQTNIDATIERCNFSDPQMAEIYTRYQLDLNASLESLSTDENCRTIIVASKTIEEVNEEIRKVITNNLPTFSTKN